MKRNIEGSYTLKYPLEPEQGPAITELAILRPNGADRLVVDKYLTPSGGIINPMAMQLEMIERLCRLPDGGDIFPGFSKHLDDVDIEALGELVTPGLPSGQQTGVTH